MPLLFCFTQFSPLQIEYDAYDGDLRITDMGQLQIFYNFTFGYVCDSHFNFSAARVACRQLGGGQYMSTVKRYSLNQTCLNSVSDPRDYTFYIDNVQCGGEEQRLNNCSNSGRMVHSCSLNQQCIAIECDEEPTEMQLGYGSSLGSIVLKQNGYETNLCGFGFNQTLANDFCQKFTNSCISTATNYSISRACTPQLSRREVYNLSNCQNANYNDYLGYCNNSAFVQSWTSTLSVFNPVSNCSSAQCLSVTCAGN